MSDQKKTKQSFSLRDEKINILVIERGGVVTTEGFREAGDCDEAYRKARADEGNSFVGMLRKPKWYKRSKPAVVAANMEVHRLQAAQRKAKTDAAKARTEVEKAMTVVQAAKVLADAAVEEAAATAIALAEAESKDAEAKLKAATAPLVVKSDPDEEAAKALADEEAAIIADEEAAKALADEEAAKDAPAPKTKMKGGKK